MSTTQKLFQEAIALPVEIRTVLVNELLTSLNPTRQSIDDVWAQEAENRLDQLKSGAVKTRPGDEVFENIRRKYT